MNLKKRGGFLLLSFLILILLITSWMNHNRKDSVEIDTETAGVRDQPAIPDIDPAVYASLKGRTDSLSSGTRIAHISDIHHYAPSLYDPESSGFGRFALNNEGRTVLYTTELLISLKEDLLSRGVSVLLVSGDLTVLGARESHLDAARIFRDFENAGIEVFVTTGNHDILNPKAFRITEDRTSPVETVSPGDFSRIYGDFGFRENLMSDSGSLSYLARLDDSYWLLALDTSWYQDNESLGYSASSGILVPSVFTFAEEALSLADREGKRVIVMTHHNFLRHYEIDFDLSNFMIDQGYRMMTLLSEKGVHLALSGHIHKSDIKKERVGNRDFYGVTTTSLSIYPHSYRILGLEEDGVDITTTELTPAFDEQKNREILEYNRKIAWERTYTGQYDRLLVDHTPEDAKAMAEYFFLANLYAQQGLEAYLPDEILSSAGPGLFKESVSFMKGFAAALPIDSPPDDRNFRLPFPESL